MSECRPEEKWCSNGKKVETFVVDLYPGYFLLFAVLVISFSRVEEHLISALLQQSFFSLFSLLAIKTGREDGNGLFTASEIDERRTLTLSLHKVQTDSRTRKMKATVLVMVTFQKAFLRLLSFIFLRQHQR